MQCGIKIGQNNVSKVKLSKHRQVKKYLHFDKKNVFWRDVNILPGVFSYIKVQVLGGTY
jgi:hypothetical protein